jgi:molybdate transport system substrate-binding protein
MRRATPASVGRLCCQGAVAVGALVFPALGCHPTGSVEPLMVFAAASLEQAMLEMAADLEGAAGREVVFNFAGSNVLAQQIRSGAPADVFLSADAEWAAVLDRESHLAAGSTRELWGNRLVVVANAASSLEIDALAELETAEFEHLVLADPESVPAGRYARSLLSAQSSTLQDSLWAALSPRVVPTVDVRAAFAQVSAMPSSIGIVYRSDLVALGELRAVLEVEHEPSPPIRYVGAVVEGDDREAAAAARRVLDHLASARAQGVMLRLGFRPLHGAVLPHAS